MTYHPEGGGEFSPQLSDPAATKATLIDLQCSTSYTITVVATAGEHRREEEAPFVTLHGIPYRGYFHGVLIFVIFVVNPGVTKFSTHEIFYHTGPGDVFL